MKKAVMKTAPVATPAAAKKKTIKKEKTEEVASLKKQYLKSNTCKVTFRLPKESAKDAEIVTIVGDFNNWNLTENKMKKLKNGDFTLTLDIPCDREYRFRYLVDTNRWENDWFADKYLPNPFGDEDSIIVIGSFCK